MTKLALETEYNDSLEAEPIAFIPGSISEMSWQKKNKDRVNIFVEGKYTFSCHVDGIIEFGLKKGLLIDEELFKAIKRFDAAKVAYLYSLRLCLMRGYTTAEISRKLTDKAYEPDIVSKTVERLHLEGYLNDLEYAIRYIENRSVRYGNHRLRQGLKMKGLSNEIIQQAFEQFENSKDASDHNGAELLRGLAKKKLKECEGLPWDKTFQRVVGFLQRRGYSYAEIKTVLKDLRESNE